MIRRTTVAKAIQEEAAVLRAALTVLHTAGEQVGKEQVQSGLETLRRLADRLQLVDIEI